MKKLNKKLQNSISNKRKAFIKGPPVASLKPNLPILVIPSGCQPFLDLTYFVTFTVSRHKPYPPTSLHGFRSQVGYHPKCNGKHSPSHHKDNRTALLHRVVVGRKRSLPKGKHNSWTYLELWFSREVHADAFIYFFLWALAKGISLCRLFNLFVNCGVPTEATVCLQLKDLFH